jgi:hypothetical protein
VRRYECEIFKGHKARLTEGFSGGFSGTTAN